MFPSSWMIISMTSLLVLGGILAALHFSFPISRETDNEGFSLSNTFRVHKKNDLSFNSQSSFLGSSISN